MVFVVSDMTALSSHVKGKVDKSEEEIPKIETLGKTGTLRMKRIKADTIEGTHLLRDDL